MTIADRITHRLKTIGLTARAASLKAGLSADAIRNVLRKPGALPNGHTLKSLAKALETTEQWLLTGQGTQEQEDAPVTTVPIVGRTGLGEEIIWLEEGDMDLGEIELPFSIKTEGLVALECIGDSMKPRYESGEVVIVKEIFKSPLEMVGQEAVVRIIDGTYLLKKIRRGYTKGKFNLESYNAEMREDEEIDRVFEIWMIVKRQKTHKIGNE
jgi:phage repressor protein C with HTH and peptisase S24 domain